MSFLDNSYNKKKGCLSMKSIGIVRKIDPVGRIVLPIELRKTLGIDDDTALEIFVDGEKIILKKYAPSCIFAIVTTALSLIRAATSANTALKNCTTIKNKCRKMKEPIFSD